MTEEKGGDREEDRNLYLLLIMSQTLYFISLLCPHTMEMVFALFIDEETEAQLNSVTCFLCAPQ